MWRCRGVPATAPSFPNSGVPRPTPTRWPSCCRRTATTPRWTCCWYRCRSSWAARRTSRVAGSRCCSRKTGRWWAASAGCWRCCSMAATPSSASPRRCRCARPSTRAWSPSARCASCSACCARTSAASANPSSARICPPAACWWTRCWPRTRCAKPSPRRPSATTPSSLMRGRRRRVTAGKSPPTTPRPWCVRPASCSAMCGTASTPACWCTTWTSSNRPHRGTKSSTCPATAATWITCC